MSASRRLIEGLDAFDQASMESTSQFDLYQHDSIKQILQEIANLESQDSDNSEKINSYTKKFFNVLKKFPEKEHIVDTKKEIYKNLFRELASIDTEFSKLQKLLFASVPTIVSYSSLPELITPAANESNQEVKESQFSDLEAPAAETKDSRFSHLGWLLLNKNDLFDEMFGDYSVDDDHDEAFRAYFVTDYDLNFAETKKKTTHSEVKPEHKDAKDAKGNTSGDTDNTTNQEQQPKQRRPGM